MHSAKLCILSLGPRLGIWLIWVCTHMRTWPWTLNTCTHKSYKSQTVCAYNPSTVAQEWQHMRIPGTCWPSSVDETQFQVQWESTLSQRSKADRDRGRQPLSTSDLSTQTCTHSFTHLFTYVQHIQNKNKMMLFYFYLNLWNV